MARDRSLFDPSKYVIPSAAELIYKMREHGTGETKLAVARLALVSFGERATCEDVFDVLESRPDDVPGATVRKAQTLALTGNPEPVKTTAPMLEDLHLPPETLARLARERAERGQQTVNVKLVPQSLPPVQSMTPQEIAEVTAAAIDRVLAKREESDRKFRDDFLAALAAQPASVPVAEKVDAAPVETPKPAEAPKVPDTAPKKK